jgi:hypothetical protein
MGEWQPIETAPDEKMVLVYWPAFKLDDDGNLTDEPHEDDGSGLIGVSAKIGSIFHEPEALNAVGDYFGDEWEYGDPTHWMPLPDPPRQP